MQYYAVLMFIFAGFIFLYAGLLAWTKDVRLLRFRYAAKMKDSKKYAEKAAKVLALAGLAPFLSALVARITDSGLASLFTLIAGGAALIALGVKLTRGEG